MADQTVPEAPDRFVESYIECALWSSVDDAGNPLDDTYGPEDLAPETIDAMRADCAGFYQEVRPILARLMILDSQAGHDFWLTRNRHGAGFWDRGHGAGFWDRGHPEPESAQLTDAARRYGSCDLYIGDDGKIYGG